MSRAPARKVDESARPSPRRGARPRRPGRRRAERTGPPDLRRRPPRQPARWRSTAAPTRRGAPPPRCRPASAWCRKSGASEGLVLTQEHRLQYRPRQPRQASRPRPALPLVEPAAARIRSAEDMIARLRSRRRRSTRRSAASPAATSRRSSSASWLAARAAHPDPRRADARRRYRRPRRDPPPDPRARGARHVGDRRSRPRRRSCRNFATGCWSWPRAASSAS